jgi:hypothetical protein
MDVTTMKLPRGLATIKAVERVVAWVAMNRPEGGLDVPRMARDLTDVPTAELLRAVMHLQSIGAIKARYNPVRPDGRLFRHDFDTLTELRLAQNIEDNDESFVGGWDLGFVQRFHPTREWR